MNCIFRYLPSGNRFPVRPFLVSNFIFSYFVHVKFSSSIKTISPGRLAKISNSIHMQTSSWLAALFFSDSLATFLPTNTDCLAKTLRLALASKFDSYLSEGYFGIKPVSIYINATNPYLPDLKYAAFSISLPQQCIRVVSCASGFLEISELEKQIEDDKNLTPLMLFADFGSSLNGDVDGSLQELSAFSEKHKLWLHITGSQISSFALAQNQSEITKRVNSISIELDCWLGLPTIPTALLYKPFPALSQSVFEIESDLKIDSFPLWVVLQNTGRERVIDAIAQAFHSCKIMHDMVSKTKGYKLLSKAPSASDEDKSSSYTTVVLFQFDGSEVGEMMADPNPPSKPNGKDLNDLYYSRLNSWLYQTLERDFPQVQLSLLEHPTFGTSIRYSPFELSMGEKVKLNKKYVSA